MRILEQHAGRRRWRGRRRAGAARPRAARVQRRPGRAGAPTRSRRLLRRLRLHTVPVYDYVLMTEPLVAGAARRDRLAAPAGHRRHRPTSSTTTGSPPTTGSCGAATTRSTTTARRIRARATTSAPATFAAARRALLRDLPAARGPALHPPVGRGDRHLHPVLRVLRHRARRRRRLRRRATPGSASARPGSAPRSCSTCSAASRHRAHAAARWCAPSRCRSRRSRCASAGIQLTRWSLAPRRPPRGPAQPVAAHPRPARPRLRLLTAQLQSALGSRVLIEQAEGALAERHGLDPADAFAFMAPTPAAPAARCSPPPGGSSRATPTPSAASTEEPEARVPPHLLPASPRAPSLDGESSDTPTPAGSRVPRCPGSSLRPSCPEVLSYVSCGPRCSDPEAVGPPGVVAADHPPRRGDSRER